MKEGQNSPTCNLAPMQPAWIEFLAHELHVIEPWHTLHYTKSAFSALMTTNEADVQVRAIIHNGDCCGLTIVRNKWLLGPYLRIFAVLPTAQRNGIGRQAINLLCQDATDQGARNFWACVSGFNTGAIAFYGRNGFETIGEIEDLVIAGESEFLIRRRLSQV